MRADPGSPQDRTPLERLAAARLWLAHPGRGLAHGEDGADAADDGADDAAGAHLEAAAAGLADGWARDEALLALATLHRRAGRREEAAALWARVAHRPGAARAHPLTELAKHHEHRERDPAAALALVERAIAAAGETPALAHRRRRLLRKLARET